MKKIRLFSSFQNKEHQEVVFNELLDSMPKTKQWNLFMYLGQLESTIEEGYSDEKVIDEKVDSI